jgi:SAM-dependent MidA family methyltransferase
MTSLPEPGAEAQAHSFELAERIRHEIGAAAGGWLSFARFMELALYEPGLGYYSAGLAKFGASGDFVTAPEISPLFARTLARQVAEVLTSTGGDLLELGAGSGQLALGLLPELERMNALPASYLILELSAQLAARQRDLIEAHSPRLAPRVQWLTSLPQRFSGLILANEVLDAIPARIVAWRENGVLERGVALDLNGAFVWAEREVSDPQLERVAAELSPPREYVSEVSLAVPALVRSLGEILERGALLIVDYGFGRREYYHPQRSRGTLMCHYRHLAHDDPFYFPGLQDITSHVDFSAVAEAGLEAGLKLLGYTTQAQFLINCGITEFLAETSPEDVSAYLPLAVGVNKLLSPAEMGELFKVIALGTEMGRPLSGFVHGDKGRLL